MIERANKASKPVLIMNEVMTSMVNGGTPSRFETNDIS
jgi:pyruvate kinase